MPRSVVCPQPEHGEAALTSVCCPTDRVKGYKASWPHDAIDRLEPHPGAILARQARMDALLERTASTRFIRYKKDFYHRPCSTPTGIMGRRLRWCPSSAHPRAGVRCGWHKPATMREGDPIGPSDCYAFARRQCRIRMIPRRRHPLPLLPVLGRPRILIWLPVTPLRAGQSGRWRAIDRSVLSGADGG